MHYRRFGRLGWNISEIGFGAWAIGGDMWGPQDDAESLRALHRAIDLGVNFIDTAQGYGKGHSEELIGKVLREREGEVYVATKVPPVPGSPWPPPEDASADRMFPGSYLIDQCERSLRRLGREAVDVYQFHTWSTAFNTSGEWFAAMQRLKEQGKIRAIGVSVPDTTPDNVIGALALEKVDVVQVIYNLFEQYPRWNLLPVCQRLGIGVIVRVPFDEGALTGRLTADTIFPEGDVRRHYFRGRNLTAVLQRVDRIRKYMEAAYPNMPMAEFALRFSLSHPSVSTVIPGIRTVAQAETNTIPADGTALPPAVLRDLEQFAWRKDFWHEEVTLDTSEQGTTP
jgi:aryl-alcohol dehydrogenase-like predicted oxidoreductase